jgi:hypothetical protein
MVMICRFVKGRTSAAEEIHSQKSEQSKRRMPVNRHIRYSGRKGKKSKGALSAFPLFCSKSLVPSLGTANLPELREPP